MPAQDKPADRHGDGDADESRDFAGAAQRAVLNKALNLRADAGTGVNPVACFRARPGKADRGDDPEYRRRPDRQEQADGTQGHKQAAEETKQKHG